MNIPDHFSPRPYQVPVLEALEGGVRVAVLMQSRRSGKSMLSYCYAAKRLVEEVVNVVYVFPTKEQARSVFWDNVENDGFKTIDHIHPSLIARKDNANMRLVLKNGSTFQVLGTTDPDALRGANAKLYIFDEFVDQDSAALDVIRPIVAVNGGQIIIQSTPKIDGISGAVFLQLFDRATVTDGQFSHLVTADQYMSKEILEELRQEYITKYGNDFFFRQEFFCDRGAASSSSYYAELMSELVEKGHVGDYSHDPSLPVYTTFDLGMSDSSAIVFFQLKGNQVNIIDFFETNNIGLNSMVAFVQSKPYNYAWHFFPHDGSVRSMNDAVSRIDSVRNLGMPNSVLLQRESTDIGINRMVMMRDRIYFNEVLTDLLRRKLLIYKRKFNPLTGNYEGPDHKTESHSADAFRYVGVAIKQYFSADNKCLIGSDASADTYVNEGLSGFSNRISV